jgi:hypothetical protein
MGRALIAGMVLAAAMVGPTRAQEVSGDWAGTYTCAQGVTALDLSLAQTAAGDVDALFHFFADPSNPEVPDGCYAMRGRFDPETRRIRLNAKQWLHRPDGYVTVNISGLLDPKGERIDGVVQFAGCGAFTLRRVARTPTRPEACRPPEPKLSSVPGRSLAASR